MAGVKGFIIASVTDIHERTECAVKQERVVTFEWKVADFTGTAAGAEGGGERLSARAVPRIAVIDSGVHAAHPHVQRVFGGVGVDASGDLTEDFVDRLGHGTAVTAVIREKAPAAEIVAIKIFDRELRASGAALLAALRFAQSQHVHLINLSLGTTNAAIEFDLLPLLAEARAAGIVIVCAAPEPGYRWLPGALNGVIRVVADTDIARDSCRVSVGDGGEVSVAASPYPRPIPGVPPEQNLRGTSFAVANTSGILACAWPAWPEWCRQTGSTKLNLKKPS
jgi:hypothetical protein